MIRIINLEFDAIFSKTLFCQEAMLGLSTVLTHHSAHIWFQVKKYDFFLQKKKNMPKETEAVIWKLSSSSRMPCPEAWFKGLFENFNCTGMNEISKIYLKKFVYFKLWFLFKSDLQNYYYRKNGENCEYWTILS